MLPGTKRKCQNPKLKLPSDEFSAEQVNSTAPVKKILTDFQLKIPQAYNLYVRTLRPKNADFKNIHCNLNGHPLYAFPDNWDGGLNSGYFETFSYKSISPTILTPLRNPEKQDPVTGFMKSKQEWKDLVKVHTRTLRRKENDLADHVTQLNEDVISCPKYLVYVAELLDNDPAPEFNDSYNWYYTGHGNLQLINVGFKDYLLHSEFNVLYLSDFSRQDLGVNTTDYAATYDCGDGCYILETIWLEPNLVALRTQYKIFLLQIVSAIDKMVFVHIKTIKSEISYTGISFDKYHKNILYVTSVDSTLKIINLDRMKARTVRLQKEGDVTRDNWNTVISSDRITYTHVNRKGIELYDKRTNTEAQSWTNLADLSDYSMCPRITAAIQREDTQFLYCTTDHHLFLLDVRNPVKKAPNAVLRWTHGMQCAPTYLTICNFEFNKELVVMSSQWCEDTCIVPNYTSDVLNVGPIPGVTMPYRPQSILQTMREAHDKRMCLDLYNPIEQRITTSFTGQIVVEQDENYTVLVQNALGDMLCYTLYPEHVATLIEDNGIEKFVEWSKSYRTEKNPFEVTAIVNIADLWQDLQKVPDDYKFDKEPEVQKDLESLKKDITDIFEKEKLDTGLLDVWTGTLEDAEKTQNTVMDFHFNQDQDSDDQN